jgi:hypothetical protein
MCYKSKTNFETFETFEAFTLSWDPTMWPKGRAPFCILSAHIIVLNKEKWYTHSQMHIS